MKFVVTLVTLLCGALISGCGGSPNKDTLSDTAYLALKQSGLIVEEGRIFSTSYHEGYNLNFEITESQAQSLLSPGFKAKPLQILEGDNIPATYYLSMYMAVVDTQDLPPVTRIDLFTYAEDANNELTLHFVSSYISIPKELINLGLLNTFKEIFEFFAIDSKTGLPAYPHYYTETLTADASGFSLEYPEASASIALTDCQPPVSATGQFSLDFIMANSQIYRNAYDKNVNYFNQSFIKANVETRDLSCVSASNVGGFHPMLDMNNLVSVQFYGSDDKLITWYYETCFDGVCENPFTKSYPKPKTK